MDSSSPITIYCSNYLCQAPNPESNRFCDRCHTFLSKRYLWVVGDGAEALPVNTRLDDRYWLKTTRIALDTKPGLPPQSPAEITAEIEPYLRLCAYQPKVPQVYSQIAVPDRGGSFLLLENAPIYPAGIGASLQYPLAGTLMPTLAVAWPNSVALRQLNWLWQIAQLWQPLLKEGVARSLLEPDFLRTEESLIRVLQLRPDRTCTPTLEDLGQSWQAWVATAHPEVASFLGELCQQLIQGKVSTSDVLTALLDRAMAACGQHHRLDLAMLSDQGPSRQRNEDACFPPSGTNGTVRLNPDGHAANPSLLPLVVVCDGIGGHEGGNVASNLAIATLQQQLQPLLSAGQPLEPPMIYEALRQAILGANDVISQRNDSEQRQERQRMGTTLVIAFGYGHHLYLAHVGDSRAYRITRTGCHQITLDDDLASREVRLGYALYRDALQQPGAGSLIQALGMSGSVFLHPTIQRFVLDEDCLFLLCSDGLSDYDRVLENYQAELIPVLENRVDLATASQRLVAIANQQNGHDNVTVGLILARLEGSQNGHSLTPALAANLQQPPTSEAWQGSDMAPTRDLSVGKRSTASRWGWLGGGLLLIGLLGALFAWLPEWLFRNPDATPSHSPTLPASTSATPSLLPVPQPLPLAVNDVLQVKAAVPDGATSLPMVLLPQPDGIATPGTAQSVIPGSILQVQSRQASGQDSGYRVQLKVCSVPTSAAVPSLAPIGSMGWIPEDQLLPYITRPTNLTEAQRGACATVPPPLQPASPLSTPRP